MDDMIGRSLGSANRSRSPTDPSRREAPVKVPETADRATVLVVDDDRFIVESTRRLLADEGFRAIGAVGGDEALKRARERRPDLILMDLIMPAMRGDEALRRLRSDPVTRDIPVIITTGDADHPAPAGATAVLTKPISRAALLEAVARAIPGETMR